MKDRMKQYGSWSLLLAGFLCILGLSLAAHPVPVRASSMADQYVWDTAGIMSGSEVAELEARAKEIADTYQCATYIVTVEDFQDYDLSGVYNAATSIYKTMEFGYGSGKDGEMLMLSMRDRDFAIIAYGDYGNACFTDYGKEKLDEVYLDNFRNNDWYGGFSDYLTQSEKYLQMSSAGTPFDIDTDPEQIEAERFFRLVLSLGIGAVLAAIVCGIFYAKMKSAVEAGDANVYMIPGSVKVSRRFDNFERRATTRRRIERSSGSGRGGGGGTSVGSGGFSGHSGKF